MADKDPATLEQEASTPPPHVSQLERSEAERARSHREELARRDADIAKLKADMARAGGAPVQGSGAGSMPSVAQPKRYCLAKRRWRLGNAGYVQIWEKVPTFYLSEASPIQLYQLVKKGLSTGCQLRCRANCLHIISYSIE